MSEEQPVDVDDQDHAGEEKRILLPPPDGYRRACVQFRNGLRQEFDCQPEELLEELEDFLGDESQKFLELRDATYGELYVLTRHVAIEEILAVMVAWVKNPAPEQGNRGNGLVVAREVPEYPGLNRERERARRRSRLN